MTHCFSKRLAVNTMARVIGICSNEIGNLVAMATDSLQSGKVIAVPTDTIYGIAALVQNSEAVDRMYNIKNRDYSKPVAISVAEIKDIYRWGKVTVSSELLSELLPGPVTVVFERIEDLNPELNPGTALVGIRIPDHKFVREISRSCQGPIALTSANVSSTQSTLNIQEFKDLWPQLDLVFDGGELGDTFHSRAGSTVVDLSVQGTYKIIREGSAIKSTLSALHSHHLQDREKR
uniref:Threonylcarbamoyl-AMP synthase n=1 Tax=Crassostrea virginica TaxID=6565 RepID=A0A8B8ALZ9_CRAVI|nr:yrdC domain-containing protein, mitochondrial-like [Crassostrea virginica]